MKNKFIICAIGMNEDQCKLVEEQLNGKNGDKYIWVFDKPVSTDDIISEKNCRYFISAQGLNEQKIRQLEEELNDESNTKKYYVFNTQVNIHSTWDDPI